MPRLREDPFALTDASRRNVIAWLEALRDADRYRFARRADFRAAAGWLVRTGQSGGADVRGVTIGLAAAGEALRNDPEGEFARDVEAAVGPTSLRMLTRTARRLRA